MVKQYRTEQCPSEKDHIASSIKICICVRKRPISNKEIARKDFDSVQYLCSRDSGSTEPNIVAIQRIEELEEMIRALKSNM
jgi:hypothetical protein